MQTREEYLEQIEKEFLLAEAASAARNEGKVRVCARRAAGIALAWFASRHQRPGWRADAFGMLHGAREEAEFSDAVRQAASRLTAKVNDRFEYPHAERPVDDARMIVQAVIERMA
jgi:hypothetical protein